MPKRKHNTPTAGSLSSAPPWIQLPTDVTANILHRLDAIEILESAQRVCTTWRMVCKDPAMWRVIEIKYPDSLVDLTLVCRRAVDLSQGQLTDIHMEDMNDETLLYVCERSSHLRRLSLAHVNLYDISGKTLTEAVKKLTLLEELHLVIMDRVFPRHVKAIGNSCPMLKSFTFNLPGRRRRHRHPLSYESEEYDEEVFSDGSEVFSDESEDENRDPPFLGCRYARAIAESMPNLRRLQLFANYIKNDGLQALLDGCPHLESLDIRQCHNVDLSGALGERCFKQIKYLRLPSDSVDDYKWDAGESPNKHYSDFYPFPDFGDSSSDDDCWFFYPKYI